LPDTLNLAGKIMGSLLIKELKCLTSFSGHLKKHFHDEYSMTLITSGSCRTWIEGDFMSLDSGDVLFLPPRVVHSCVPDDKTDVTVRNFFFERGKLESCFRNHSLSDEILSRPRLAHRAFLPEVFPDKIPDIHAVIEYHIPEFFDSMPALPGEDERPGNDEILAAIRDYIERQFADDMTLEELSVVSGLSRFHLVRSFRRKFGLTPYAYLLNVRINAAMKMLRSGMSITDVACDLHFYDQSHFTNTFTCHVGLPPGVYRDMFF
jgi:AraC-like DNA-binding protein